MTEPDVASSDATNIATRIERDGDEYVINGRKWWITGAMNPHAEILIVMGKTDPTRRPAPAAEPDPRAPRHPRAERRARHARVRATTTTTTAATPSSLFERRARPGLEPHRRRGRRLRDRPGPPRPRPDPPLHALDRRRRARDRADVPAGRRHGSPSAEPLADQGVIRDWIAESRVRIEQLRLLVLKTAWLMDTVGNKGAHTEIQAIKIATPADRRSGSSTRRSRCTAPAGSPRTSRSPSRSPASAPCASPTAPTRCTRTPSPRPRSRRQKERA